MLIQDYLPDLAGIAVSAAINVGLHIIYNRYKDTYFKLQEAAVTELTPELLHKIKDIPGGFRAFVYGTVLHYNTTPIRCDAKPAITGVIHKHTIMEHVVTKVFGLWVNETQILSSHTRHIPFMLHNNGIEIIIENPSKLERYDLVTVNDVFEPAKNTVFQHLVGWMKNMQRTGIQEFEEMLIEGTKVMGIGRVISRSGVLHLIPEKDLPYIVTTEDRMIILEQARSYVILWRLLKLLSLIGSAYMIYRLISHIMNDQTRKKKIKEMRKQFNERLNNTDNLNMDTDDTSTCVVCFNLRDVVLIPCGHICVCKVCAWQLNPKICPICRKEIIHIQEAFYS